LLDQVAARESLSREVLLRGLHGLGVPILREAVDGDSRIVDRVPTTVRRVQLVNETLLRKGLRAQVLIGFLYCALLLLGQGGTGRCRCSRCRCRCSRCRCSAGGAVEGGAVVGAAAGAAVVGVEVAEVASAFFLFDAPAIEAIMTIRTMGATVQNHHFL
jgi:hypothetical protein